jgi:hypothetical protein
MTYGYSLSGAQFGDPEPEDGQPDSGSEPGETPQSGFGAVSKSLGDTFGGQGEFAGDTGLKNLQAEVAPDSGDHQVTTFGQAEPARAPMVTPAESAEAQRLNASVPRGMVNRAPSGNGISARDLGFAAQAGTPGPTTVSSLNGVSASDAARQYGQQVQE